MAKWLITSHDEKTNVVRMFGIDGSGTKWAYLQTTIKDVPNVKPSNIERYSTRQMRERIERLKRYTESVAAIQFSNDVLSILNGEEDAICGLLKSSRGRR